MPHSVINTLRQEFLDKLASDTFLVTPSGIATIADSDNATSRYISQQLAEELGA